MFPAEANGFRANLRLKGNGSHSLSALFSKEGGPAGPSDLS